MGAAPSFRAMAPLALALHLALAAPAAGLTPPLDTGRLRGSEMAAATLGVFAGDALVIGAGYLTLRLFANGTLDPNASNFRTAAYGFAAAALVVPPLTAALFARWARSGPASGAFWKALILASVGQATALTAGYAASPRLWVILPVQIVTISLGASFGLHWGPRSRVAPVPAVQRAPEMAPSRGATTAHGTPFCPDLPPAPRRLARVG
jgi:hypothetical protein